MKRRRLVGVIAIVMAAAVLRADSPLTSTDLATAYADLAAVKEARATRKIAGEVLRVLIGAEPNDRKAAVVNALGWQTPGNAGAFLSALAAARGIPAEDLKLAQLTASDRFVLGYLRALETYAEPAALRPGALDVFGATPSQLLAQASLALPGDFTVQYVGALVEAQLAMAGSWCSVYLATARVIERFPPRRRNMRPAAVAAAQSYMDGYKKDCADAPKKVADPNQPARLTVEHNQNYALARLGETIVAATQAGIVVWHPDKLQPVASRNEAICPTVLVWHDAAWAGCYGTVVRWDGAAWKGYLQDPTRSESDFVPLLGPAGELLVRHGADVWRYDSARDAFARLRMNLGAEPFHVLFRRNGEPWRIDFLKAVVGPNRTYARKSAEYPGSDPRKLVEDGAGRLWVLDSDSGVFRLDDAGGRFEHDPALGENVTDMAFDVARERTWLLEYERGPVLVEKTNRPLPIDLKNLQYMRGLLLDERSGDVWVAGWTGLVRLREDKGRWRASTWRAGGR